jgi:hypothetical protein
MHALATIPGNGWHDTRTRRAVPGT